ncbi:MAG: hypothetical protein ACJAZX_000957 [Rickettsiales bacterium]|jgi:hypothetical protein
MQQLIRNPVFRVVGILVILYYGLFYNKNHPDSLGNRFTPTKITSDIKEVSTKSFEIIANVRKAEELSKKEANTLNKENLEKNKPKQIESDQ